MPTDAPPKPTASQARLLDALVDLTAKRRGVPPTIRELGAVVGVSSPSTVHYALARLQQLGWVERDPLSPRTVQLAEGVTWPPEEP
jgi:repressor LexA